ncbi:MAG: ABC transporter ATP-binding protein [Thermostichus sp. DRC_bins_24]
MLFTPSLPMQVSQRSSTHTGISTDAPLVQMQGIRKSFAGVLANDGVDFELQPGEIHALLGENGAGKTTLMNILAGLYQPDGGEICLRGQRVQIKSPRQAIQLGIGMVHQHFMLVQSFTVADNIVLGQGSSRSGEGGSGWLREDPVRLHEQLRQLAEQYGLQVDPAAQVAQLSVGEQQRVEILKAIYRGSDILILDEPTAVLTPQEVEELLQTLRALAAQGTGIVFISHKLKEVLALCHRVTVLRDGRRVGTIAVAEHLQALGSEGCERLLAQMMVGREVNFERQPGREAPQRLGEPLLTLKQVVALSDRDRLPALRGIDLQVHPGEIVGVAGVDGNGQRELEEVIAGLRPIQSGSVQFAGSGAVNLAHIPSDRYSMGLLSEFSVAENAVLRDVDRDPYCRRGWLDLRAIARFAQQLVLQFTVKTPSIQTRAGKLSGGNAQKLVLGRELARQPRLILAAQPTRGLDINAIEYVHHQLLQQRQAGAGILLISTELEEILRLSDRIVVLYEGQIRGETSAEAVDIHQLGLWMAGRD